MKSTATVTVFDVNTLYFSAEAVTCYGLQHGKYIHFGKSGSHWYFVINDDKRGFFISRSNTGKGRFGARIQSKSLVRLFAGSVKCAIGSHFRLQSTRHEHNKCRVIEIITANGNRNKIFTVHA